jgi:phosphoserine phosphatase
MSFTDIREQRHISLVVFDMDGVLVDVKSSWQFIHQQFGVENTDNVNKYLKREISYQELMKRDIALWGRVHIDKIKRILSAVPLMPGAIETVNSLKESKLRTALISAGVSILAERLQKILGLDRIFANRILANEDGFLTGEGQETVNLLDKTSVLRRLAFEENIELNQCAVVGDSIYDVPLFKRAGLSIAFNPDNEEVSKSADVVVTRKDLREILRCLPIN